MVSVFYGKVIDESPYHDNKLENSKTKYKVKIFDEVLSYGYTSNEKKIRKGPLIDTSADGIFLPKSKYQELLGNSTEDVTEMLVTKRLVQEQSRTFIFSREMMRRFRENCQVKLYLDILEGLHRFGNRELFIIDTEHEGLINMNALPLAFKYKDDTSESFGSLLLPLNIPASIPEKAMEIVRKIIANMNIVLQELVQG